MERGTEGTGGGGARPGRRLVLAAHPDDEVLFASSVLAEPGTLVLSLTDGAPRDRRFWPAGVLGSRAEYAALRAREQAAALARLGVPAGRRLSLGAIDQEAATRLVPLVHAAADVLRALRPARLLLHPYEGGHPDHDACAFVGRAAAALLRRAGSTAPELWEMASYHLRDGRTVTHEFAPGGGPCLLRRIRGAALVAKRAALASYDSQHATLAAFEGSLATERFRPARAVDFGAPPSDGPLLYERWGFALDGAVFAALAGNAARELSLEAELAPSRPVARAVPRPTLALVPSLPGAT